MVPLSALCERSDYVQTRSFELLFELNGEIAQLQFALNDDYNNFSGKIKHVPHFKAHNWKVFSQTLCFYVHFGADSLIHSAPR